MSTRQSVAVHDWAAVGATVEVKRFIAMWDALFSKLPFRPETAAPGAR